MTPFLTQLEEDLRDSVRDDSWLEVPASTSAKLLELIRRLRLAEEALEIAVNELESQYANDSYIADDPVKLREALKQLRSEWLKERMGLE